MVGTQVIDPRLVQADSPGWIKLAFFDGAKKLERIGLVETTLFTATNLSPGYHVFSVLGTNAEGRVRTSDPVMVVVRRDLGHQAH
jgi:hypothetical protein